VPLGWQVARDVLIDRYRETHEEEEASQREDEVLGKRAEHHVPVEFWTGEGEGENGVEGWRESVALPLGWTEDGGKGGEAVWAKKVVRAVDGWGVEGGQASTPKGKKDKKRKRSTGGGEDGRDGEAEDSVKGGGFKPSKKMKKMISKGTGKSHACGVDGKRGNAVGKGQGKADIAARSQKKVSAIDPQRQNQSQAKIKGKKKVLAGGKVCNKAEEAGRGAACMGSKRKDVDLAGGKTQEVGGGSGCMGSKKKKNREREREREREKGRTEGKRKREDEVEGGEDAKGMVSAKKRLRDGHDEGGESTASVRGSLVGMQGTKKKKKKKKNQGLGGGGGLPLMVETGAGDAIKLQGNKQSRSEKKKKKKKKTQPERPSSS
jgi:hypothetical protein